MAENTNKVWSNFLEIDGEVYNIKVYTGLKRNLDFLARYSKRLDNGYLHKKLIGVYKNFKSIQFEKQTDENYDEYNRLYAKLSECEEFHTIKIGNFTFNAYFSGVNDVLYRFDDNKGREYFKNLTVDFTAEAPFRTKS